MNVFPSDIAQEVRDFINRPDSNFPTDDELFTFISRGMGRINDEINRVNPAWNATSFDFQRSSTQATYDLPVDFGYILHIEDITDDDPKTIELRNNFRQLDETEGANTEEAAVQGNQIRLGPIPNLNDSQDAIRVHYARSPENLHAGTIGSATSTTVTFPSSPSAGVLHEYDSAYVHHQIHITSGAAVGQQREISAYTESSRVATVDTAFNPTPSNTDNYELMVEIPRITAAREALISYVAKQVMRKDEMPDNVDARDFNKHIDDLRGLVVQEGFHSARNEHHHFHD